MCYLLRTRRSDLEIFCDAWNIHRWGLMCTFWWWVGIREDVPKRGSKELSPLFSGHPWPFLALWRKKSRKFVAIIDNRLVPMYEFLRCFYVASLNPSIIDTIFGTLSPGRAKRRARASPRIDLILPPEKVWQKKTMMSKIPPYTRSLQQQWNADSEAMLRFVLLSLLMMPQMVCYYY